MSAGIAEFVTLENVSEEHYDRTLNLNARASLFTVQKALPLMSSGSTIVLVRSVADAIGYTRLWCVQREQGRTAIVCTDLDERVGRTRHPGKRCEPGAYRDVDDGSCKLRGQGHAEELDSTWASWPSGRGRRRSVLPGVEYRS